MHYHVYCKPKIKDFVLRINICDTKIIETKRELVKYMKSMVSVVVMDKITSKGVYFSGKDKN